MGDDIGASLSRWHSLVRRARIGDSKKLAAALMVATYANPDGTSVKCGVARLAADCEMGYSTARRYLAWLREVGLIELVRAGNRKAKRSDEYRLTIGPNAEKALSALDEGEYRDLVDGIKVTNRDGEKGRRLRSPKASADTTHGDSADEGLSALTPGVSADSRESGNLSALAQEVSADTRYLRSPMGEPLPFSKRSPSTGGAPPPDPRRPEPPPSSGSRIAAEQEISAAHHPAQDQQGESLPHARANGEHDLAPVVDIATWRSA